MARKTKKWFDDVIESELLKCVNSLQLDRMPTANELKSLGRQDLHMAIQKSKKYSGWAEHLGLGRKQSETVRGQNREEEIAAKLESLGHKVERMTTKHPYDLLVNDTVKIDVKTGKAYLMRGSRVHSFGISKKDPTCDIYIVLALDEQDQVERLFVIPSHHLKVVSLCIGKESIYNRFINCWEYIDQYTEFFKQIV